MTHAITSSSEGVWTKRCVVFRPLLMAIFAFGVNQINDQQASNLGICAVHATKITCKMPSAVFAWH